MPKSLKVIESGTIWKLGYGFQLLSIVTMAVCLAISEIFRLFEFDHSSMLTVWYLSFVPKLVQISASHWDRHTYAYNVHLMTSRELTSGFVYSRGHLRMAVMHLHIKFGADIFIQSGVIDIFPKFKIATAATLDFQIMWIWLFRCVDSVVFVFCTKLG